MKIQTKEISLVPLSRRQPQNNTKIRPAASLPHIRLFNTDNLALLRTLNSGSIDAIYIDPPFFTNREQVIDSKRKVVGTPTYSDKWQGLDAYITWLQERVTEMRRVLSAKGVLILHCDWHASHYIKVMLDSVFGYTNFRNEVIWQRAVTIGRMSSEKFRKLDTISDSIFIYSKNEDTHLKKIYRTHVIPFSSDTPPAGYYFDEKERMYFKTSPLGNYSEESIASFRRENRIYTTRNKKLRLKYFVDTTIIDGTKHIKEERELGNLWTDIPSMMHSSARDKILYPTQKPIALVSRLLSMCAKKGSQVADFFHGSGTTMLAAGDLGCDYIGSDVNPKSISISLARLPQQNYKKAA